MSLPKIQISENFFKAPIIDNKNIVIVDQIKNIINEPKVEIPRKVNFHKVLE